MRRCGIPHRKFGNFRTRRSGDRKLLPDDTGHLWVLREGSDDHWFFDVFDPEGIYLGAVDLPVVPSLFAPPVIGPGSILVVTHDELDVQYVVRYEIRRP